MALCFGMMTADGPFMIPPAAAETNDALVYTVVIDAGSSGSRIALYEVKPGTYPEIRAIAQRKRLPGDDGIDNFLDRRGGVDKTLGPDAVGEAVIGPLLDAVAPALNARGVHAGDVVVDLLATAGMRSTLKPIGTHDPAEIEAFYDGIRQFIAKKGFAVGDVRTIDGSAEEGLWTWIDVNDRYRDAFRGDKAPVGVVEIGGSSVQVSYPTAAAPDVAKNIYAVTINGRSFSVFDRSYIGLGPDDARRVMRIETPPGDGGRRCFPTGMQPAEDSGDIVDGRMVRITGPAMFEPAGCRASYTALLKERFAELGAPDITRSTSPFYGIKAARFALEEIGAAAQRPTGADLAQTIATKCAPPNAVTNFKVSQAFAQRACSTAAYIEALLYGPSGLFHENPELLRTTVADQVVVDGKATGSISWTTGYLLQKYAR